MTYSRLELLEHKKPYELFNDVDAGDTFAEHQGVLDRELSEDEQLEFAIKLISGCPQDKLADLTNAAKALYSPIQDHTCFYSVIDDALQVKIRLLSILNNENMQPHTFLLEENTPDLLQRFNDLAREVLEKNEIAIAERLALLTPDRDRSKLAQNIRNIFPNSALAEEVNAAFTLRRNIEQLVGETPEIFFTDRDFSRDTCLKFSTMLSKLLAGQETDIGSKLSKKSFEVRQEVRHKLELLTSSAFNSTDPFHLIAKEMNAKRVSIGTNSNSMYGTSPLASPSTTPTPSQEHSSINSL
ncbi:MAG: hypothetical protein P4L79_09340 [Legionella sp.]|uniref:lpg0008 family Dot/Icm T4SS effector n=1 Tax=Legionella sp. TaxID=459 RepID=UPI00283B9AA7|nr:hypothetical protein [Legionella sp.]